MKYLVVLIYYYNVIQFLKGKILSNGNIFIFKNFKGKYLEILRKRRTI